MQACCLIPVVSVKSQDVSSGSGNVENVHGNRNWFAEMEASFMVRMFLTIEFRRG